MSERTFFNYVGGKWEKCLSGKVLPSINPADNTRVVGYCQNSSKEDLEKSIKAAQEAYGSWKKTTPHLRAGFLKKVLLALTERRREIAELLTLENGKTLQESLSEVDSAVWEMEFQINEGLRAYGATVPSARPGIFAFTKKEPLGVVGIVTPWNFPVNVPFRKLTPALMAGNTVIFKPASFTSCIGGMIAELFEEVGFPEGVFNFITGPGGEIGENLVSNVSIRAVSFTGSTEVGLRIEQLAALHNCRVQLEMGGKNPLVVLKDADIKAAAKAAVIAGYACAGQWCTSTSRVIVEKSVAEEFMERLLEEVRLIKVGPGNEESSTMGPVAGEAQLKRVMHYIEKGNKEGAKLVAGGKQATKGSLVNGCFVEPTVFDKVTPDMTVAQEEIFGPVLCIIRVNGFEEAIEVANGVKFGLASSVYTDSFPDAMRFIQESEVGLTHVNMITAYKEPPLPFGGVKDSGAETPEAGKAGIEFFSRHKVVYMNYESR